MRRITVNLAPADMRKEGPVYDLPILLSLLCASGEISALPEDACFIGELSLSGELRPIHGALPMAMAAAEAGMKRIYLPLENAPEAAYAENIQVYGIDKIMTLIEHFSNDLILTPEKAEERPVDWTSLPDFSDIKGQESAKKAIEVAVTGRHNLLMVGPPGSGKSMLASRIPSILPPLTKEEALECTKLYSVAGLTNRSHPLINTPPFRSPHHTISMAGLSGGGRIPRPGEVSLSHNGILFLDELPEFSPNSLDILRQPLEEHTITISRVAGSCSFPCSFMLVCAMNPCKCGWYGHPSRRCSCRENERLRYISRISGPLLDRIDMQIQIPAVQYDDLRQPKTGETSKAIATRVLEARKRAYERGFPDNASLHGSDIARYCQLDKDGQSLLRMAFEKLNMTARGHDRVLKVARTIADLDGSRDIMAAHLAQAIQFRTSEPEKAQTDIE